MKDLLDSSTSEEGDINSEQMQEELSSSSEMEDSRMQHALFVNIDGSLKHIENSNQSSLKFINKMVNDENSDSNLSYDTKHSKNMERLSHFIPSTKKITKSRLKI